MLPLILASSSPYRRQLLDQLQLPYQCISPDVDESLAPQETAPQAAKRLALIKAQRVSDSLDIGLVIGSDQTAEVEGLILGKPGTADKAIEQLRLCSGKTVRFWTGLALVNVASGNVQSACIPFTVQFRSLTEQQIQRYVQREQPLDCAGSFKCEGLGIALFERLAGDDPNALIGLPLIQLVSMLSQEKVDVLTGEGLLVV